MCVKFCFLLGKIAAVTVMLKKDFKNEATGKTQVYEWLIIAKEVKCQLKTNCNVAALPWAERRKMLNSSTGCPCRSLPDHWQNFLNNRCVMEVIKMHFIGRFYDETGCCKICAASAHRWEGGKGRKKKVRVNVSRDLQEELKYNLQFLTKLKQVMGVGAIAMTLSQSSSQLSGRRQICPN